MRDTLRGFQKIAFLALFMVLALLVWGNHEEQTSPWQNPEQTLPPMQPKPSITPGKVTLDLPRPSAENGISASLAVTGGVVVHSGLNAEALKDGGGEGNYDYTRIFEAAAPYLNAADAAVSVLETSFPEPGTEFTAYPMFKSPDGVAEALASSGITLLNTASNHCMDSQKSGLDRTLDVIEEAGMSHVGTYRSRSERNEASGVKTVELNGIRIAFLAYTYGTNGMPVEGNAYAVNIYNRDYRESAPRDIDYTLLRNDMSFARNDVGADIIAVFVHWGNEYDTVPNEIQTELTDFFFEEGADIILGGHPHVPQPLELRRITDEDGSERLGLVSYSLGNFVSCMEQVNTDLTAVLKIDLEKDLDTGKSYIVDVSYRPMIMMDLEKYGVSDSGWRYRLWDLHGAIESYDSGDKMGGLIDDSMYNSLVNGLDSLHRIMGEEYDKQGRD